MKKYFILIHFLVLLFGVSCASTGFFSHTGLALITNMTEPIAIHDNISTDRRGEACTTNILGIASQGDASIAAAKKAGNIRRIATVEAKYFNVLAVYGQYCTIVTGE